MNCLFSILKGIGSEIGSNIAKYLWNPTLLHIGYVTDYNSNVMEFRKQVENLRVRKNQVQKLVDAPRSSEEDIDPRVLDWLKSVADINKEASELDGDVQKNEERFHGLCPYWCSRHEIGEKVKNKTSALIELRRGGDFHSVLYLPSPTIHPTGDFAIFESTKTAMNQVMDALKDGKSNLVGVYGMGGVGKTTLMKRVGRQMQKEEHFKHVVMVTVSQNQNIKNIQGEIAENLDLKFDEDSEPRRARTLLNRLQQEETILIILDDLWGTLEFAEVGIALGGHHNGCKIVLTTRDRSVCQRMKCKPIVEVTVLSKGDSWELFKRNAGDLVESPDFYEVAQNVCKECGGLPLAIAIVGRALSGGDKQSWDDALVLLKSSNTRHIADVDEKVKSSLMLSYNYLKDQKIQLCLLFCSLFPEDFHIDIEVLMRYGIGEGFFMDVNTNTLEQVRAEMRSMVDKLKDSCLLLDGYRKGFVKLHDVVRDVAINIASNVDYGFFVKAGVELTRWVESNTSQECQRISLAENKITKLPDRLNCSKLRTLLLQGNESLEKISDDFFRWRNSLMVLDLSRTHIRSMPSSLSYQTNLRTLCLDNCSNLQDISLLKGLKKLEILSLRNSSISFLPEEIGELANLKLLDLTSCGKLEIIASKGISRLSRLEELLMEGSFSNWEIKGSGDGIKASIAEVASLCSNLTVLHIHIKKVECLTQEILGRLREPKEFCISVGEAYNSPIAKRSMHLNIEGPIANWAKVLLERTEHLSLTSGDNFDFNNFYYLNEMGFKGLTRLHIKRCNNLRYLFTSRSLASGFKEFENLEVRYCKGMKMIIAEEEEGMALSDVGVLPRLKNLELRSLPRLSCFHQGQLSLDLSSLETIEVLACWNLKRLPLGLRSAPNLKMVYGAKDWFETLEWDDSTKLRLHPLFRQHPLESVIFRKLGSRLGWLRSQAGVGNLLASV